MKFDKIPPEEKDDKIQGISINGTVQREMEPDTQCGIGSFRPAFLQIFARIGAFVGVYGVSGLLTSTLTVYINSQVNMLEKQFGFSSAETGLLMSCNDIGFLSCVIFAGFIARKVHIPRGLGISTVLFGICGMLCALPYFLQDRSTYELEDKPAGIDMPHNLSIVRTMGKKVPMCENETMNEEDGCNAAAGSAQSTANIQQLHVKKVAYCLIAFGMVFQGVGKSVRYPFVTLYVDDAVNKRKTGFYMGILIGTGIFGPALAYLIGGLFSKLYITLEPVDITPSDPRWIGAWWLGFLVFGACALFFSIPIMCFPRKLKSKSRLKDLELSKKIIKEAEKKSVTQAISYQLKDFGLTITRLLRNPVYVAIITSSFINVLGVSAVLSFMPKYLAAQYTIPLWQANIIIALSYIGAVAMGTFIGGVISRKIEMTPQTTFKLMVIFHCINFVCLCSGFFLGCDQPVLLGDNGKGDVSSLYRPVDSCIQGCTCDDKKYFPVCGGGRTYFSPCHAGCTEKNAKSFTNCTCIQSGHAVAGLCDQGCSTNLYTYAAFTFVGSLCAAFKIIPTVLSKIRCVEERDRAVASAFSGFINSALGWMPGPVIFGAVIDGTCTLWKYTCGERQSCLLYDIVFFRKAVHGFGSVAIAIATLINTALYICFRVKGITKWRGEVEKQKLDKNVIVQNDEKKEEDVQEHIN
ncbi:solute carrier organic anion transporter family member 2A1-like [Mercenaria mercenaria]|uniref:solute carrier organic anion transporter family member 2A1-like n=1 Tax=Mercenaria mercenaria TaxID=6596 RepID=UPI00234F2B75|nr:solute carrier organic anion transporter family member 2A1-like [Mercenaria mercenaria]XP_053382889.1 solute carrier organic anion transporter family member 2A1-like [Mercenaria mercenaria]